MSEIEIVIKGPERLHEFLMLCEYFRNGKTISTHFAVGNGEGSAILKTDSKRIKISTQ